jgi:uncharacterized protein YheU (UPF0270 family)
VFRVRGLGFRVLGRRCGITVVREECSLVLRFVALLKGNLRCGGMVCVWDSMKEVCVMSQRTHALLSLGLDADYHLATIYGFRGRRLGCV